MRFALTVGLAFLFVLGAGEKAEAIDQSRSLKEGGPVLTPFAFVRLCMQRPVECRQRPGGEMALLDAAKTNRIRAINKIVNKEIRPTDEKPSDFDQWRIGPSSGDCDDYAVTKRSRIIASKIVPPASVRIAVGVTPQGEGHAVVIVRTEQGDIALDNRSDELLSVNQVNLVWIKMESARNPRLWRSL